MSLKIYSPSTAGQRGLVLVDRSGLWKGRPHKKLCKGKPKSGGRSRGRMTSRHRGGGHKRLYRTIDFRRMPCDAPAVVERIEYDPNRSAHIALITHATGQKSYVVAPEGIEQGASIVSGEKAAIRVGNAMPLKNVPVGTLVHNVELKKGKGAQMARAAGTSVQVVGHDLGMALLRLPSGEMRKVSDECTAVIGVVSNGDHKNRRLAKAGRSRWIGKRPHVRGVAMNPVDHPHGGNTSGGKHWSSPWGQSAKGLKTRSLKKASNKFIVRRRKSGR